MSNATLIIGAMLAAFVFFLLVNNRLPTYASIVGL